MVPLYLAPLRGVTLAPFRRALFARFGGVDGALAPFASPGGGKVPERIFADVAGCAGAVPSVTPQVIGKDPAALREAAKTLRGMGFTRMNLNAGCPWKFVAKKGRGCGLPENPDAFRRMLEAGCEAMPGGFSVKIRLGWHSPDVLAARAALLNEFPLESVTVHPRTGDQMYGGAADLDAFASVFHLLRAPVVYNGDVFRAEDAVRVVKRVPAVAGIMIGRGLCMRPWLAEEVRAALRGDPPPRTEGESRAAAADMAEALAAEYAATLYGPAPLVGRLKELWSYLHAAFEDGDDGLRAILHATTPEALLAAARKLAAR